MYKFFSSIVMVAMVLAAVPTAAFAVVYENGLPNGYGGGGDPVSCELFATPDTIPVGGGTTLTWEVSSNVVSAFLTPKNSTSWMQAVPLDGSWYISGILDTRQYTLTVVGAEGQTATCDTLITVDQPVVELPFCEIAANPGTIPANGATTLEWTSSDNVVSAVLHPQGSMSWSQSVPVNGSWYISGITDSRTYSLTVTNSNGDEYTCDAPIVVSPEVPNGDLPVENPDLSCEVEAVPSSILAGGATTLVWTGSAAAVSAKISPTGSPSFFATVTPSGSWYISGIADTRSYTITVFDAEGNFATCDAPITVTIPEIEIGEEDEELLLEIVEEPLV